MDAPRHLCPGGCEDRRHTGVGGESKSDHIACPQVGGALGSCPFPDTVDPNPG